MQTDQRILSSLIRSQIRSVNRLRAFLPALAAGMMIACGGAGTHALPPPAGPVVQEPDPPVEPVPEPVPEPEPEPPPPEPAPVDPLAAWFQGGFEGKTLVVWGNSTVSHAVYFFQQLRKHAVPGGVLEGLDPGRILNYGNNGASLAAMLNGQGEYPVSAVIAAQPDLLIVRGPLINDVRLGAASLGQAILTLEAALDQIRSQSPRTSILLTTENSLLTTDPGGFGWVQPATHAQPYTDILRQAVLSFEGRYPNVKVFDVMAVVYGTMAPSTSPLMANQIHPNQAGQFAEANVLAMVIGMPGHPWEN